MCPSANGLQFLIDKLLLNLSLNSLNLNANKSKYMRFYCKNVIYYDFKSNIKINGINLELVRQCNYLGTILSDDMCIKHDVERACNKFLKQVYSMYNKFYYLGMRSLIFLFDACCTSFYGCELRFNRKKARREVNKYAIAYHKGVKKIASMGTRDCNHEACAITGLNIFNHLIDIKLVSFLFSIISSKSRSVSYLKRYFAYNSFMYENVRNILNDSYNVSYVLENDRSAICARIDFIQRFHVCSHL